MHPTLPSSSSNQFSPNNLPLPPPSTARRSSAMEVGSPPSDMGSAIATVRLARPLSAIEPPTSRRLPALTSLFRLRNDTNAASSTCQVTSTRSTAADRTFQKVTTQLMALDKARHRLRNDSAHQGGRGEALAAEIEALESALMLFRDAEYHQEKEDDAPPAVHEVSLQRLLYLWATFNIEGQFLADMLGDKAIEATRHLPDERRRWLSAVPCLEARWQPANAYLTLCHAARLLVLKKDPQTRYHFVATLANYMAEPLLTLDQAFLKWHRAHLLPHMDQCLLNVAPLMEEGRMSLQELDKALHKEAQRAQLPVTRHGYPDKQASLKVPADYPDFSPKASAYVENWSRQRYDPDRQTRISTFLDKLIGMPTAPMMLDDVTCAELDYILKHPDYDKHLLNALDLMRASKHYHPEQAHACSQWLNRTHLDEADLAAAIMQIEVLTILSDLSRYTVPDLESRLDFPSMNGLFDRLTTDASISSRRVRKFCTSARTILAWIKHHTNTPKQAHEVLDSLLSRDFTDHNTANVLDRISSSFGKSPPGVNALKRALGNDPAHPSAMDYLLTRLMR